MLPEKEKTNLMKRYLIALLLPLVVASCKETDSMVNQVNNQKMKDSLKKVYPSLAVSQIRIEVRDFRDVEVLLGDEELYSKTDEELQEITKNIATMTYFFHEENNYLGKGKVTYIANERSAPGPEEPKREFDMHLETFKK